MKLLIYIFFLFNILYKSTTTPYFGLAYWLRSYNKTVSSDSRNDGFQIHSCNKINNSDSD